MSVLNDHYQRSDAQLYGAFKYPTLRNEDAVLLATLMDDCLYQALNAVDTHTNWITTEYAKLVVATIFKGANKSNKSYSMVSDRYFVTTLPQTSHLRFQAKSSSAWLHVVRDQVAPFREIHLETLSRFEKHCSALSVWSAADSTYAKVQMLEKELGCGTGGLYGAVAEAKAQLARCHDITARMARPYLRRVVSEAMRFAKTNDPNAFLDNYQNGYWGVMTAIGKYNTHVGAFAYFVDIWIKNKMISGISNASNSMSLPDRVWRHKKFLDAHPTKTVGEIAKLEGVSPDLLSSSSQLLEVRTAAPLIEENDENADSLDDYHDRDIEEIENHTLVLDQLKLYTKHLSAQHRLVLGLAFDVNLFNDIPQEDIEKEAAKQLYVAHARAH